MRFGSTLIVAALILTMAGCARPTSLAGVTGQPTPAVVSEEASATANGVKLAVALSNVVGSGSRFNAAVTVSVPGSRPIRLAEPGGSWGRLEVRSVETSAVVFDSIAVDKEAIASQPAGFKPDESETLSDGSSSGPGYRFNLQPGRYVLTARTFGPVIAIEPLEFVIR